MRGTTVKELADGTSFEREWTDEGKLDFKDMRHELLGSNRYFLTLIFPSGITKDIEISEIDYINLGGK